MKTFELTAIAYTTLVIEAEDEEQAYDIANQVIDDPSGWEFDGYQGGAEELRGKERIDAAIRHSEHHRSERQKEPYKPE